MGLAPSMRRFRGGPLQHVRCGTTPPTALRDSTRGEIRRLQRRSGREAQGLANVRSAGIRRGVDELRVVIEIDLPARFQPKLLLWGRQFRVEGACQRWQERALGM